MSTNTPSPTKGIDLSAIATHMAEVEAFSEERLGMTRDELFSSQIQTTRMGLFRLVVMGELKKGKSSFINALCGIENLVPELSDVATSTIYQIRFGQEKKYTVFFRKANPDEALQKKEISPEQVKEYGTESGNPDNAKNVDFIEVEAPSPALINGWIIVDTPGVGGLFKQHRDITWRYAPNADAIFFITDSVESPIGADEVLFLKDLLRATKLIYFIQTKTDKVEAKEVQSRKDNNIDILTKQVEFPEDAIVYYTVSSKLKQIADKSNDSKRLNSSGFVPLMQFLNQTLKAGKDRTLSELALKRARAKIDELLAQLDQRKAMLEADSAEKQNKIKADIQTIKEAIESWVIKDKPELDRQVRREMEDIIEHLSKDLKKQMMNRSTQIKEYLETVDDPELLYACVPSFVSEIKAELSAFILEAKPRLDDRLRALIEAAAIKMGIQISSATKEHQMSDLAVEAISTESLAGLAVKASQGKGDELLKSGYYGANMYGVIGGTVGAIVGSIVPVIGTGLGGLVGGVIGGLWGGYHAVEATKTGNARKDVLTALNKFLNEIYDTAQSDIKKLSRNISDQVSDSMSEIIRQSEKKLSERKSQIESRTRADSASLKKEGDVLKALTSELGTLRERNEHLQELLP